MNGSNFKDKEINNENLIILQHQDITILTISSSKQQVALEISCFETDCTKIAGKDEICFQNRIRLMHIKISIKVQQFFANILVDTMEKYQF